MNCNGCPYYKYLLVFINDLLVLSHEPKRIMDILSRTYCMKEGSFGKPMSIWVQQLSNTPF
jgi:hypothetical protein